MLIVSRIIDKLTVISYGGITLLAVRPAGLAYLILTRATSSPTTSPPVPLLTPFRKPLLPRTCKVDS